MQQRAPRPPTPPTPPPTHPPCHLASDEGIMHLADSRWTPPHRPPRHHAQPTTHVEAGQRCRHTLEPAAADACIQRISGRTTPPRSSGPCRPSSSTAWPGTSPPATTGTSSSSTSSAAPSASPGSGVNSPLIRSLGRIDRFGFGQLDASRPEAADPPDDPAALTAPRRAAPPVPAGHLPLHRPLNRRTAGASRPRPSPRSDRPRRHDRAHGQPRRKSRASRRRGPIVAARPRRLAGAAGGARPSRVVEQSGLLAVAASLTARILRLSLRSPLDRRPPPAGGGPLARQRHRPLPRKGNRTRSIR